MLQGFDGWHPIAMAKMEAIPHTAVSPDSARHAIIWLLWRESRAISPAAEILARARVIMNRISAVYVV
jgi:hypothetical protein